MEATNEQQASNKELPLLPHRGEVWFGMSHQQVQHVRDLDLSRRLALAMGGVPALRLCLAPAPATPPEAPSTRRDRASILSDLRAIYGQAGPQGPQGPLGHAMSPSAQPLTAHRPGWRVDLTESERYLVWAPNERRTDWAAAWMPADGDSGWFRRGATLAMVLSRMPQPVADAFLKAAKGQV